ncbi:hypothetical protein DPMN_054823 [Dreissena polymorpha]|uniref:Uncharacterized protein n=1 Tax=Dreissena polymorpha TaxID=45954 RepID=A0A9D4HRY0_DREPO|nr:hypothetical protein DPMN_054823 [Dreissena polymorpha]
MNAKELHEREECLYPLSDQTQGDVSTHETFYMITTCKGADNCFDFEQTPWGAFSPVYSPSHHKIYINEQCALCNGLTDGKPWHSYIVCPDASPSEIDAVVSAVGVRTFTPNCYAHFIYPYDDKYMMYKLQCYTTRHDLCPDSIDWNPHHMTVFDEFGLDNDIVVDLCHSSIESVYTQQLLNGQKIYFKNIFCFLCSGEPVPKNTCTTELKNTLDFFGDSKFAMLLAWEPVVKNATITKIEACKLNDESRRVCAYHVYYVCSEYLFFVFSI